MADLAKGEGWQTYLGGGMADLLRGEVLQTYLGGKGG